MFAAKLPCAASCGHAPVQRAREHAQGGILISSRLDQVYMPSGASEAGESEPDMYPASQWAVTTDPANEVLSGIYIGVRRGRAACSALRARYCAARTSAKTKGITKTRVPARLDGYCTQSCQVSRGEKRRVGARERAGARRQDDCDVFRPATRVIQRTYPICRQSAESISICFIPLNHFQSPNSQPLNPDPE